ncbi:MAG: asparagine synthase (glutamine-hydrolyzing) [Cyanobacteria bacterium]|nr:asparagine synthase (glutamine-hydrolyzing) [Cyanobacteriota bacterium]
MCGIAGIVHLTGAPVDRSVLQSMTDAIAHRGPDDTGCHVAGPVGIGNRRLSIIDLSAHGHQPMANETGDVFVTYNGAIYNFRELRIELERDGHRFQSHTDTEVIVHAYEQWGDACVDRFNGMFAFAICDSRLGAARSRLLLARDRYGIKPLYYAATADRVLFGSEIKALLKHPEQRVSVSPAALSEYFTFQNTFSDLTLFEGVRLLPPGHVMVVDVPSKSLSAKAYWDFNFQAPASIGSFEDTAAELKQTFESAVSRQLVADVSVGSYLSGGIDSSSLVAVAVKEIPRLRTFTGGFDMSSASGLELGFDERVPSERISNHFKTEHYEMVLHAGDMEYVLPKLIWHLEDLRVGQCYPNYYVAGLAGKFVRVVLSGSGGDELFGGYPWRYYRGMHAASPDEYFRSYYDYWQRLIPDHDRGRFFNGSTWNEVREYEPFDVFRGVFSGHELPLETAEDFVNASLYFEIKTFLHGLLVVEDKLSMAHGLETRVPFLDNAVVDLALKIPPRYKLSDLEHAPKVDEDDVGKTTRYRMLPTADGKRVLREAVKPLLPNYVWDRPKQGFSAPDASWFRGESIDYVNRLLRDPRARIFEFIEPAYVGQVLDEHTSGRVNHRLLIWSLLSFEWWCRSFLG